LLIGALLFRNSPYATSRTVTNPQFLAYLQNDQIDKEKGVEMMYEDGAPNGVFTLSCEIKSGKDNPSGQNQQIHTTVYSSPDDTLQTALKQKGITPTLVKQNNTISNLAINFLPIGLFLL